MRLLKNSMALIALSSLVLVPTTVSASGNSGHGNSGAPKTTSTGKKSGGPAPKTTAPKTTGSKAPKTAHGTAKASSSSPKKTSTTTQVAKSSTVAPSTPIDFTSTRLGQKLSRNEAIRSKLETRLQALGYTGSVYQAAYGYKNQGQLMASVNNAQNLGISFEQLKLQMTGYTVAANGTILRANLNPDGTISMLDPKLVTNPAPTKSLGQAKQTFNVTETAPSGTR
jgi:hypothetical protein